MNKTCCAKCGIPLPRQDQAPGRPKTFCSAACRRAAALEVRRIDTRLAKLETELMNTRLPGHLILAKPEELAAEIARQEDRLRKLLSVELSGEA